jgi:hypothetical protein
MDVGWCKHICGWPRTWVFREHTDLQTYMHLHTRASTLVYTDTTLHMCTQDTSALCAHKFMLEHMLQCMYLPLHIYIYRLSLLYKHMCTQTQTYITHSHTIAHSYTHRHTPAHVYTGGIQSCEHKCMQVTFKDLSACTHHFTQCTLFHTLPAASVPDNQESTRPPLASAPQDWLGPTALPLSSLSFMRGGSCSY